jgi:hypothetical protein
MRRPAITIFAILLIATGLNAAWWFRHDLGDLYHSIVFGPLPGAVTYDQVQRKELAELRARLITDIEGRAADAPAEPRVEPEPEESEDGTVNDGEDAASEVDVPVEEDSATEDPDAVPTEGEGDEDTLTEEEIAAAEAEKAAEEARIAAELQAKKDAEIRALAERRTRIGGAFNLAIPFTPQAPFAVWDELHNEGCEEASAVMVKAYFDGELSLSAEVADERILAIAEWEQTHFGSDLDTDAEQTARFMREHLGLHGAKAVPISSIEDVTSYVSTGTPVILPAYGKALGNPYFRGEGPLYHMLVVKGFKDDLIIVNDPGTKRGADYIYDAETLWNAVHDWNGGDVQNGRKVMIVAE